ncbi:MAG: alpha/beta-type small acid-soluble spore protein, partial [Ruminococcus sp.]|nr:alpha/beta-type small acid-soluble spore protein [Ruminococcus sp.]
MKKSTTTTTKTTRSSGSSSGGSSASQPKSTPSVQPTAHGRDTLERFKMEAASEVGVQLKNGYNGNLTSKQAGAIGGQMVKKMIDSYKKGN